jgi:SnoaL-like domain
MSGADDERAAVLRLLDDFGSALEARDLEGSLAAMADGPDVAIIPSEGVDVYRGRSDVEGLLRYICAGPKRYGWRWRDRWVSIEGEVATLLASGDELVDTPGEPQAAIPYCLTGTVVRRDGQ